jgi:ABC-type transport system involved in multi-copper enzyme maturation permease subunit
MKKIVGITIFLLVIMAFCGAASAYTITDKGSQTVYRDSDHKDVYNWYCITLSNYGIGFQLKDNYMYRSNGNWKLKTIVLCNYYLTKSSGYSKVLVSEQVINKNGLLYKDSYYTSFKTSQTAYQVFKYNKAYIIKKCKTDTRRYAK